ncbi:MAG: hypothetical protein CRU78_17760 [Candidatus Accumulibacter phosphatis]|uniref:HPr-rel-A system PqqD family peptide chaperone n=1 Tax=Candidatus Accumulibacter phosphatis TaxID=327160 RepID=A0A6A7RXN3_9PROT|nr:hypothetical protein [Candidatus Accumulibacter phosphatis]
MTRSPLQARQAIFTPAGGSLAWQAWDDVYVVYQRASAETHVFNETTRSILMCLENGALPASELKDQTEAALGVGPGELAADDFALATRRLEELGLVEYLDDANTVQ